ncbi:MAG: hypothetical protein KC800_32350, partial [Candidatus Eremiobacteraeota bacterium]|nr:hypothetical protein [Candidatus Eremiobacteraeota bacterium]
MRSNLNRLVFLIFALLFAGCGGGGPSSSAVPAVESVQTGSVAFRLGQPSRILAQIVSVEVEVLNPNTEQAVLPAQQLVFGQEVIFSHVPVGVHLVRATGYASDGSIESRDQVEVLVVAGQTTRAQLILNNPSPEPTETP